MKIIYTTKYYLYNKKDITISIISDIHFNRYINNERIDALLNSLSLVKPDYILIPGDLIDSVNELEYIESNVITFIKMLSIISKVIISIGNHDFSKKNTKWFYYYPKNFYKKLSNIKNVYVLNNDIYKDNDIYICGITPDWDYYKIHENNLRVCSSSLVKILNNNKKLITNLDKNKLNICMIHSPESYELECIQNLTKEFNYIVCGHMHNGCVPPLLNELWKSDRGIIGPKKNLFPRLARNTLNKESDKLIVTGAVTTFSRELRYLNILYPINNTILIFNKNNTFKKSSKYTK